MKSLQVHLAITLFMVWTFSRSFLRFRSYWVLKQSVPSLIIYYNLCYILRPKHEHIQQRIKRVAIDCVGRLAIYDNIVKRVPSIDIQMPINSLVQSLFIDFS